MNNQVKITINNKDYYCDMEVLKLIERLQDKIELLEYNRDKAIEYINKCIFYHDGYIYPDEAKITKMISKGEWKDFGEDNE